MLLLGGCSDADSHYATGEMMVEVENDDGYRFWGLEVGGPEDARRSVIAAQQRECDRLDERFSQLSWMEGDLSDKFAEELHEAQGVLAALKASLIPALQDMPECTYCGSHGEHEDTCAYS
jgi:hypothetical protein